MPIGGLLLHKRAQIGPPLESFNDSGLLVEALKSLLGFRGPMLLAPWGLSGSGLTYGIIASPADRLQGQGGDAVD